MGFVKGLDGQEVIPSERFFTGGGTTLWGFEQDKTGPLDARGDPLGGEGLLAARNEPRLRLLPPYREHLSQAFARFFMRVVLPVEVATAW